MGPDAPLEYVFVWRHANSAVFGDDGITVAVDDNGSWSYNCGYYGKVDPLTGDPIMQCFYGDPWIPEFHVNLYRRLWRTIASAGALANRVAYRAPSSTSGGVHPLSYTPQPAPAAGYAYCAPAIDDLSNTAVPCDLYVHNDGLSVVDSTSGAVVGIISPGF